jgi:2-dehydro-3-deoxy-D-arabinonate dehydratase
MQFSQPRAQLTRPDGTTTAYDLVYAQDPQTGRPEIFFKAQPGTAVGSKEAIGIRFDSEADVPEGELILVLNDKGDLVGYTMGNDVSSRDIEGQNPLYLPQAKVYANSAAIGPFIELLDDSNTEAQIKAEPNSGGWKVNMTVIRSGQEAYKGDTVISGIKNTFANLITNLRKSQHMPHGAALFTGTGIIPPMDFKLQEGDIVKISIGNLGTLENVVKKLPDGPVSKKDLDAYSKYASQQTWAMAL